MNVIQNPDIAWQEYDGEAVLVDPEETVCMVLNDTASFIWKLCEKSMSIDELSARLSEEYDVSPEEAGQDVGTIVSEFLEKNILKET